MPTKEEIYAAMATKILSRKKVPATKMEPQIDAITQGIARLKAKRKPNEPMSDQQTD